MALFKKFNDQKGTLEQTSLIGGVYFSLNQLDSALHYYQLAYQLGSISADSLRAKRNYGFRIATVYEKLNNHREANKYYKIAINAITKLEKQGDTQRLLDLEYQEKERMQEAENAKAEYTNKFRLYASLAGLLLFLVISLFLYRNNRQKQKANALLQRQRDEIHQQRTQLQQTLETLQDTQAQLIQKEKLASLGELTAGIAHEIQNPLNFVNNFSEVSAEMVEEMQEELNKGDIEEAKAIAGDLQQNLQKITHHGGRASAIVKGMLEHSRASTGERQPTNLNQLADEYLRLAYHGLRGKDKTFNAQLITDFDTNLSQVNLVAQDMGRVLLNLYNNAFYAVQQRQLRAEAGYEPTVWVSTTQANGHVEIRVRDNGTGIPEAIKAKIFQPFFTTKPTGEGTGLGLSLSYDIITKGHGGTIEVETKEGEGSDFVVTLPITSALPI